MDYQQVEIGGLRDLVRRLTVENEQLRRELANECALAWGRANLARIEVGQEAQSERN